MKFIYLEQDMKVINLSNIDIIEPLAAHENSQCRILFKTPMNSFVSRYSFKEIKELIWEAHK